MFLKEDFIKFITIYNESSLSKAADKLDLYQGALSKTLKRLETLLGDKLFIRSNRGLIATEKGQRLYSYIHSQQKSWDEFISSSNQPNFSGQLRLGGHAITLNQSSKSFSQIYSHFPYVDLKFEFLRSPDVTRKILNFELEGGLVVNPTQHNDLVLKHLYTEDVCMFSHKNISHLSKVIYNPDLVSSYTIKNKLKKIKQLIPIRNYHLACSLSRELNYPALLPQFFAKKMGLTSKVSPSFFKGKVYFAYRSEQNKNSLIREVSKFF